MKPVNWIGSTAVVATRAIRNGVLNFLSILKTFGEYLRRFSTFFHTVLKNVVFIILYSLLLLALVFSFLNNKDEFIAKLKKIDPIRFLSIVGYKPEPEKSETGTEKAAYEKAVEDQQKSSEIHRMEAK